jgi:hypothetical protein
MVICAWDALARFECRASLSSSGSASRWVGLRVDRRTMAALEYVIAGLRWDTVGDASGSGPRGTPSPPTLKASSSVTLSASEIDGVRGREAASGSAGA